MTLEARLKESWRISQTVKEADGWAGAQSLERGMGSSQSPVPQFYSPHQKMHPEEPVQTCPGHCWIPGATKKCTLQAKKITLKIAGKSSDAF